MPDLNHLNSRIIIDDTSDNVIINAIVLFVFLYTVRKQLNQTGILQNTITNNLDRINCFSNPAHTWSSNTSSPDANLLAKSLIPLNVDISSAIAPNIVK